VRPTRRALADETECLTWLELRDRVRTLADQLVQGGLREGQAVVLLSRNSVFFVVALLAIQLAGGRAVLLDPETDLALLPKAIEQTGASLVLVREQRQLPSLPADLTIPCVAVEALPKGRTSAPSRCGSRSAPSGQQCFALLLTSGTSGAPKVVTVTQLRAVLSGYGMGVLCLALDANDVTYCVLPLTHATALMTALCPALITGSGLVLRRRFSAKDIWRDLAEQQISTVVYVGELARRLLDAPPSQTGVRPRVETLYGNAMPLDVWHRLQARLGARTILEFYGATELPLAMVNLAGIPGYMGRIPLRELSPWQIAPIDADTGNLRHDCRGRLERCAVSTPGELVFSNHFETGDIVVRESDGFVKHLERRPGLFRQNGHNVSCKSIAAALRDTDGIEALGVTHVTLPRYDGQAGLLIVVPAVGFELTRLRAAYERLPRHQRPRLLRLTRALRLNRGLKLDERAYRVAGVDPDRVSDPIFAYGPSGFVPIDSCIWRQLQLGTFRF